MSDNWFDNVNQKILFKWMLCEYITDWQNTNKITCHFEGFHNENDIIQFSINVYHLSPVEYLFDLIKNDNMLSELTEIINITEKYKCQDAISRKIKYTCCDIRLNLNKLTKEKLDIASGLLCLLGYKEKIMRK